MADLLYFCEGQDKETRYSHTRLKAVDCSLHFGIRDASLSPGFKTPRSAILEDDRLLGDFW